MNMSRAMAFEKLRVAYALERRPALAAAFEEGAIPWSAVRILTRLDDPDPMVDEALIELARSGGVRDLEAAVRYYRLCLDQELPADLSRLARRGLRLSRGVEGFGTLEATLDEFEMTSWTSPSGRLWIPRTEPRGRRALWKSLHA